MKMASTWFYLRENCTSVTSHLKTATNLTDAAQNTD